jgi:hypothetical protein
MKIPNRYLNYTVLVQYHTNHYDARLGMSLLHKLFSLP